MNDSTDYTSLAQSETQMRKGVLVYCVLLLLKDGKVYTWSLVRVSYAGYKSDKSFNSFKVIKK